MRKPEQERSEKDISIRNGDEDARGFEREDEEEGENDGGFNEDGEADDGGEFDVEDSGGEQVDAATNGDFQRELDEQRAGTNNNFDEQDDARHDWRTNGSKFDRDNVKRSPRETEKKSDDSGSSGDHSKSSFDDPRSRNMKTLQYSVRNKELPLRIAYEQLDELAANAEKVKSAIEKNRAILNVQVIKGNSRYLRAAFAAWKLDLDWQKRKRRDIIRANAWRRKSLLLLAFRDWRKDHVVHAKLRRLEKSVMVIIHRHNMRRCWYCSPSYLHWLGSWYGTVGWLENFASTEHICNSGVELILLCSSSEEEKSFGWVD